MLNVGYTLIYHKPIDDVCWVGRTVNLIFRPGVCSARTVLQPVIEWNTMVGGKSKYAETRTMKLLNINAISTSNAYNATSGRTSGRGALSSSSSPSSNKPADSNSNSNNNNTSTTWCSNTLAIGDGGHEDEFDCFFTITSQDGDIHLFEALNSEDSQRIVSGIKYNAYRLSKLLIEGNSKALLMGDFYDNSGEPQESRLSTAEAMHRLSNAFLDGL